jgi:nicotinate phosphoribosyltransferase
MNWDEKRMAEGILFTDMYQLTMAQVYFRHGLHERRAQFDHFFRSYPDYGDHKAGFCINAGLEWFLDWMQQAKFGDEELAYLRSLHGPAGDRIFADDFLDWLRNHGNFARVTIRAIPEGRVVHPNVPLTVVEGPLAIVQIMESALLNHLNYQTLIATKAARIGEVTRGQLLLEFGMRRGHERGVNAGARGALIGGAGYTSNVGASAVLGYAPQGTHAHSMVQVFLALGGGELEAFRAYAGVYPDNCILLVDTIDTLESGVPNAITVFDELRRQGHKPRGIRLDSGDLAYLGVKAAAMLNEAGFHDVAIVLSNQLDELTIWQIQTQIAAEAPRIGLQPDEVMGRLVYGVGTRLITSAGDAALDGVFKLVAVEDGGSWQPAIKISETPAKVPNPGQKAVWRIYDRRGRATADMLTVAGERPHDAAELYLHHPIEHGTYRTLAAEAVSEIEPLLVDIMVDGELVYELPSLEEIRAQRTADVDRLHLGVKRLMYPHIYHVSLSKRLWELKEDLIAAAQGG